MRRFESSRASLAGFLLPPVRVRVIPILLWSVRHEIKVNIETPLSSRLFTLCNKMPEIPNETIELSEDLRRILMETPSAEQSPLHDGDLPLHKAAYKGNNSQLASLITSGVDINARSVYDCTPLQLAIRGDHAEAVSMLLSAGADATLEDDIEPCYHSPFHAIDAAAWLGAHNALVALINHGLKVPASALRWAASLNHVGCVQLIVDNIGSNDFSDQPRPKGLMSALNVAATCWHLEVVEVILAHVATIPATFDPDDGWLSYALVCAAGEFDCDYRCRWNHEAEYQFLVMQKLIATGADVNWKHPQTGETAFSATLDFQYLPPANVRLLLNNGLILDTTFEDGRTPLFGVVKNLFDDASLVRDFLGAGAKSTVTDNDLNTPLHLVMHRSFAELLSGNGADLSAQNSYGMTPFHTACEDGRVGVAEFLLSRGALVDERSKGRQCTPLLYATGAESTGKLYPADPEQQEQMVQLLLAHGANAHVTTPDGRTPLHGAVRWGSVGVVNSLIEHGADVHAVAPDGKTALHAVCALSGGELAAKLAITNTLLGHGANVEARDKDGSTPLHASWSRTHYLDCDPDLFNLLLKRGADRLAENSVGKKPVDFIDDDRWTFDEEGMVRERPMP